MLEGGTELAFFLSTTRDLCIAVRHSLSRHSLLLRVVSTNPMTSSGRGRCEAACCADAGGRSGWAAPSAGDSTPAALRRVYQLRVASPPTRKPAPAGQ